MDIKEYIYTGGTYYYRSHSKEDFWNYVVKGLGYDNKPSEIFQQEVQDIKDGKALVLYSGDEYPKPVVKVFYPKFEGWEKNPKLEGFKELTVEEIFNDKESNRK